MCFGTLESSFTFASTSAWLTKTVQVERHSITMVAEAHKADGAHAVRLHLKKVLLPQVMIWQLGSLFLLFE